MAATTAPPAETESPPAVAAPAGPPAPPPQRPRTLLIGSALAGAGSSMVVVSMLGLYLARRADVLNRGDAWFPDGVEIPLPQPNMMFATLLMSAVTLAWASWALRRDDRQNGLVALGVTTVLAFAFLVQSSYLFTISEMPVDAPDGQGVLFWSTVGTHYLMVLVGLVFLALVSFRALSGGYRRLPEGINAAGVYWGFVIATYAAIWLAIYITK